MTLQVLQEALKLQPSAVREACLLAQLYMMAGQPEDALETARAVREAAPADSDAHGLFILLSEAEGPTSETVTELSQAYLELLVCDPASQHALQGGTPLKQYLALCKNLQGSGELVTPCACCLSCWAVS